MFANRYTALIDACVLAGALRRHLILRLAEAGFFRVRWSRAIMDETQAAIETIRGRRFADAADYAARVRAEMERAFVEATVSGFDHVLAACKAIPDAKDRRLAIIMHAMLRDGTEFASA